MPLIHSRQKGFILVITGATLWGISGTVAQFLFHYHHFTPEWLVSIRLLISGFVLLVLANALAKNRVFSIWKNRRDILQILFFSILGMLAVQYTYFAAIKHSNAATATVLQYLAPVLIAFYLTFRYRRKPSNRELVSIILAIFGTFLLVTKGSVDRLTITGVALFWGLLSAFALAFYTLQPLKLLAKYGSMVVVGWGMLIGGVSFSFIHPPWIIQGQWSLHSILAVCFIVLFGTLIAFIFYLESLKYISASETSVLACVEPLSAAFLSVIWLQVRFGIEEWIGTLCIISTIMILSTVDKKNIIKLHQKLEPFHRNVLVFLILKE
ncbi:DMT family transporter [Bacillus carboniphilus]